MTQPVFHLIPHTHWDREWYATRTEFLARLVPMLDGACAALAATPGLRFLLDGQTVVAGDYLSARPEAWSVVAGLVAGGQLQTGPAYALVDELIPSGESLVRNLLLGQRDTRALRGEARTFYTPDAFGHPAALPLLAQEFGLRGIALWRGRSGTRDFFRWQAPDGSTLPVYHFPAAGYEVGEALPSDPARLADAWPPLRAELLRRAATRHVAIFIGADHHPLRTDLPALAAALADLEPEAEVRVSALDEFMVAATTALRDAELVTGELREGQEHTWALQGVHGTRLPLKRFNALTELLLERHAEPLAALAARFDAADQRPLLDLAWRLAVQTQFHDTISGTVHDAAAAEGTRRLCDAVVLGRAVRDHGLRLLGGIPDLPVSVKPDAGTLLIWNPRATEAGGVMVVDVTQFREDVLVGPPDGRTPRRGPAAPVKSLILGDGTVLHTQILHATQGIERVESALRYPDADRVDVTRLAVLVPPMPGLAVTNARLSVARRGLTRTDGAAADARVLRNQHLAVRLHGGGRLDLEARNGVTLRRILQLEQQADLGDCYTPSLRGRVRTLRGPGSWRVAAEGPLLAAVEGDGADGDVRYRFRLELRHEENFLRVRLDLENRGTDQRLRLGIPVGVAPHALAGAPFGHERRRHSLESPSGREQQIATAPAQRFVAAASAEGGAALLTPGHMEYELGDDGKLFVTLLRSTGQLSRGDLPERPGHAAWPLPVPGAQCQGWSSIHLALVPCTPPMADDPVGLMTAWEQAFLAPHARWFRGRTASVQGTGVDLVGHGLAVSAVKPAAEGRGVVLRAVNLTDGEVSGAWRMTPKPTEAWRLRADEMRLEKLDIEDSAIPIRVPARALSTILVL